MKPDLLRILDKWIGSPACRLLGLFTGNKPGAPGPLQTPRRILIIKLTEMGSTVLALPALRELRMTWPDAEWHMIVFRNSRSIIDALQLTDADRIIELDDQSTWKMIASGLRAIKRLRKLRADISIDFDFFSRLTALLAFFTCRGIRIGYQPFHAEGKERGRLLTHRVIYSPLRHASEAFLSLTRTATHASPGEPYFRATLADADFSLPRYQPPKETIQQIRRQLAENSIPTDATIILINTNASELLPLRRWPREHFEQLIQGMIDREDQNYVILVGGQEDVKEAEAVRQQINSNHVISMTGKTTLEEFFALCSIASLIVCNDGGPAHFAGLVGLPAVVLFGPESPDLYKPLSKHAHIFYRSFPCSPCVHVFNTKKSACRHAACLESIAVTDVLGAVRKKLEPGGTRP